LAATPASEPPLTTDQEENSFVCSSSDFSCGGENHYVSVCHYTTKIGYRTYCLPEADSEIVRFYATDYCGPCVGGFGNFDSPKLRGSAVPFDDKN
jgi:hypothetical protein